MRSARFSLRSSWASFAPPSQGWKRFLLLRVPVGDRCWERAARFGKNFDRERGGGICRVGVCVVRWVDRAFFACQRAVLSRDCRKIVALFCSFGRWSVGAREGGAGLLGCKGGYRDFAEAIAGGRRCGLVVG